MQLVIKIILSLAIILAATAVVRRTPSLAGLIGVMPLTGALVFVWLYLENKADTKLLLDSARGSVWGLIPSIGFFVVLYLLLKNGVSFPFAFGLSFLVWIAGAVVHQYFLSV